MLIYAYPLVMLINGPAVKAIRERSGHTQVTLAAESKVSQTRISRYESQDAMEARPATVKALADALKVPITAITHAERVTA